MDQHVIPLIDMLNALMSAPETEKTEQANDDSDRNQHDLKDHIRSEYYFSAFDGACGACGTEEILDTGEVEELRSVTFCTVILNNGFVVVGKSHCADPKSYSYELGCKYAKQDAYSKVAELVAHSRKQEEAALTDMLEAISYGYS